MNQETTSTEKPEPRANTFFVALAASQEKSRGKSPAQVFHWAIRQLKSAAEEGDIREWQLAMENLESSKSDLALEGWKELEVLVQLRKMEMTLLLNAAKKADSDAQDAEMEAELAGQNGDDREFRELGLKAQRLRRLAQQFNDQLLSLMEA